MSLPPLTQGLVFALQKLVDDAGVTRAPSHDQLSDAATQAGVRTGDVRGVAGKGKRVRAMLSWALTEDPAAGARFVASVVTLVRVSGGFRSDSSNYCGDEPISGLRDEFAHEGWVLDAQGYLVVASLPSGGSARTDALRGWAARLSVGLERSPIVPSEENDVLALASAWVVASRLNVPVGQQPSSVAFASAYSALGLSLPGMPTSALADELAQATFSLGQALLRLRDPKGLHGWHRSVDEGQALWATRSMGQVTVFLLRHI
jgi:hypothetical protein